MNEPNLRPLLLILFVGVLMGALDLAIIGPALPAIQADLGIDNRALAWIFNIYVLFQLVGTPLMAKLSDRYGRRAIYVLSLSLFGLGSLILATASSVEIRLIGRALQGLGAVFGIAFLVGPILGGVLLRFSWHWLFLINLPIVALLIWQAWRLLPGSGTSTPKPFDAAGALLLSAVLAPVFWRVERGATDPIVPPRLLGSLQMRLTGAIAVGTLTLEAGSAFFPALAVAGFGLKSRAVERATAN